MRTARAGLVVAALLAAILVLPRAASTAAPARPQPAVTPTVPDLFPSPTPSPTPSPSPTRDEREPDEDERDKKDEDKNDRKAGDGRRDDERAKSGPKNRVDRRRDDRREQRRERRDRAAHAIFSWYPTGPIGSFSTDRLDAIAARLISLGMPSEQVVRRVYTPFIIGGRAAWSNTWGAPRFGPGKLVRTHEGQDVFCDYGAPVLAAESGVIEFAAGGLGGRVARLHRSDGTYWYYAHLSDWNTAEFASGDRVRAGDVIGFCGTSGNAATTPPHVHFGWYETGGGARNPMASLIAWLHEAEARAARIVEQTTDRRVRNIDAFVVARRFGDALVPALGDLPATGESLWASGSDPGSGALALAEAALSAAMAPEAIEPAPATSATSVGSGSQLSRFVRAGRRSSEEHAD